MSPSVPGVVLCFLPTLITFMSTLGLVLISPHSWDRDGWEFQFGGIILLVSQTLFVRFLLPSHLTPS